MGLLKDIKEKNQVPAPAVASDDIVHVASGTHYTGNMNAKTDVRIDGVFDGTLHCDATVIIGSGGVVYGEVFCHSMQMEADAEFTGKCHIID